MSTMIQEASQTPEPDQRAMQIARVTHEANRAWCLTLGDASQPAWDEAPDWQRASAISGVAFHLAHPNAGANASHDEWMRVKREEGWVHGPEKNPELKQHPCMVPFDQLPAEQQAKDRLFRSIVHALASDTTPEQERISRLQRRLADALKLLSASRGLFRAYQIHHLAKPDLEKATRNGDQANLLDSFIIGMEVETGSVVMPKELAPEMVERVRANGGDQAVAYVLAAWPDLIAARPGAERIG